MPPNVNLSGFFQFGMPQFLERASYPDERRWQLADTVVWVRGNHTVKFGEDYIHTDDNLSNLYNQYGQFFYSGNQALGNYVSDLYLSQNPVSGKVAENYSNFSQGVGAPGLEFTTGDYAFFAQDEWKVNRRLSLTLGLRWEHEKFPNQQLPNSALPQTTSIYNNSKADFAPRIGFAYDVYGGGKTILRGGYGMFFARAINSTLYQSIIGSGVTAGQINPTINPGATCAPQFPQIVSASCLAAIPTAYYLDRNFKVPEIHMADLTLEQQFGKNDVLSISWLGSWGRRLPDFVDVNLPSPTPVTFVVSDPSHTGPMADGSAITTNAYFYVAGSATHRPNPNYSSITDIFSGVNSNYEALVASFNHRLSHGISLTGNYTWSHAMDFGENNQTSASVTSLLDPNNLKLDYGNSNQNVPNRLVIAAVGNSPWHFSSPLGYLLNGFSIAPGFSTQSGLPYSPGISSGSSNAKMYPTGSTTQQSIITTSSFNGTGGANRLPNFDRNAFQYPKTWGLDLRVSKKVVVRERYSLEFFTEAFNLTNHQNVTGLGTTAYQITEDTTNHVNKFTPFTSTPYQSITSTDNSNFAYNVRQLQMGLRLNF
ncbi:MAG TPA: TonB-dependent receptor [Terracidiphilus sp.]